MQFSPRASHTRLLACHPDLLKILDHFGHGGSVEREGNKNKEFFKTL